MTVLKGIISTMGILWYLDLIFTLVFNIIKLIMISVIIITVIAMNNQNPIP